MDSNTSTDGLLQNPTDEVMAIDFEETDPLSYDDCLSRRASVADRLRDSPYCLPLHLQLALCYFYLQYPDLAAGAAYKALLLLDAIADESDEYHEQAREALEKWLAEQGGEPKARDDDGEGEGETNAVETFARSVCMPVVYHVLIRSLYMIGCYKSAINFCSQAEALEDTPKWLPMLREDIRRAVAKHYSMSVTALDASEHAELSEWPDAGMVRRERYPWNDHEPDRFAELETLNGMMRQVAPKFEVLAVELLDLTGNSSGTSKQLGVFAEEDIAPGEVVLDETSMLTANNKLQDALCDACSADLPDLSSPEAATTVSCPDCEVVFCSQRCFDLAMESYHPALCEQDVDNIAKDVTPAQAADSLYALLLLRSLAMAETQQCHPLDLNEVKYIWADFHNLPALSHWHASTLSALVQTTLPKTLPFSFEHNIRLPLHIFEKMDLNIFTSPYAEVWVFNTLYAKFRGTASARLSGLGGRAIRGPEVSAVHPMWCLANHSCDPNVGWEWGGSIRFWARENRAAWRRGAEEGGGKEPGIKKGEEVLNHYCDVELPVQERREWARGALGGDCQCERCKWEAGEAS